MRLLTFEELQRQKGIPYCRDHLRRKVKAGEFPKPVDLGARRIAWIEEEIDAHLERVVANRDQREATAPPVAVADIAQKPVLASSRKNAAGLARTLGRPQGGAPPRQQRSRSRRG
jgi:prophage regulatory protein